MAAVGEWVDGGLRSEVCVRHGALTLDGGEDRATEGVFFSDWAAGSSLDM